MAIALTGGLVVDGTGAELAATVLVDRGRIAAVLAPGDQPSGAEVIDATGNIVAPGFIDLHPHADFSLQSTPDTHPAVSRGRRHPRHREVRVVAVTDLESPCAMPRQARLVRAGDGEIGAELSGPGTPCGVPGQVVPCSRSPVPVRGRDDPALLPEVDPCSRPQVFLKRLGSLGNGGGVTAASSAVVSSHPSYSLSRSSSSL